MTAKKAKKRSSSDGLTYVGIEDGKLKYKARLVKRAGGKKIIDTERMILAENKADALNQRDDELARLVAEKQAGASGAPWTVNETLDSLIPKLRRGTLNSYGSHAKKIRAQFGEKLLRQVRPDEVQRFLNALTVSEGTANSVRDVFARIYKHAKDEGRWLGQNPILTETHRRVTYKTEEQLLAEADQMPANRALIGDELDRFLATLQSDRPDLYAMCLLQLILGCRFSEVSALEWRKVDFATSQGGCTVIVSQGQYKGAIGTTKGKKPRMSAIGPVGRQLLLEHRQLMSLHQWPGWERLVFPRPVTGHKRTHDMWPYNTVLGAVSRIMAKLELRTPSKTHAMRHSMISAAQTEKNDTLLRKLVGHSSEELTHRYTSVDGAQVIDFATRVELTLLRRAGGGRGGDLTAEPPRGGALSARKEGFQS